MKLQHLTGGLSMLKTNAILEIKKEDRIYTLSLPHNSPLGEIHDVLIEMKNFVVNKITEINQIEKPKEMIQETQKSE